MEQNISYTIRGKDGDHKIDLTWRNDPDSHPKKDPVVKVTVYKDYESIFEAEENLSEIEEFCQTIRVLQERQGR